MNKKGSSPTPPPKNPIEVDALYHTYGLELTNWAGTIEMWYLLSVIR